MQQPQHLLLIAFDRGRRGRHPQIERLAREGGELQQVLGRVRKLRDTRVDHLLEPHGAAAFICVARQAVDEERAAARLFGNHARAGRGRRIVSARHQVCLRDDRVPAHVLRERHPVHQLHREEPLVAFRQQLVQRDEVRVRDVGQRPELLLESVERGGVDVPECFERDRQAVLAIERLVDDAEAAAAKAASDLESRVAGELALNEKTPVRREGRVEGSTIPEAGLQWSLASVGAWLSLVEHSVRDRGVGGSNPLAPTNFSRKH